VWKRNNPEKPLDPDPQTEYNTHMENEKFNDTLEIEGDLRDEYRAIQEAEHGQEPEIADDEEIQTLLRELWEEFIPQEEEEYTEKDAFQDFVADQYEDFNE
jgi:hypothetical protein